MNAAERGRRSTILVLGVLLAAFWLADMILLRPVAHLPEHYWIDLPELGFAILMIAVALRGGG